MRERDLYRAHERVERFRRKTYEQLEARPFQDFDGYWCVVDEDGFAIVGERFNTEKEAIRWMERAEREPEEPSP
jgi:hypothetical protein